MPATPIIPDTLSTLLSRLRTCFTRPGFEAFTALLTGLVCAPLGRTVCGMLTGAGLAGRWHHSRAHRFFSTTRWDAHRLGLAVAHLIVAALVPAGAPILLAVDETLARRRGPKVHAASWWHDGSAAGSRKIGYGNSWVVLAIVVHLPFCRRPVALPVLFALCTKGGRSKPDLARDLLDAIAEAFPERSIDLVADSAYGAGHLAGLGANITITTRARRNAVFHHSAPPPTGRRGRPRKRGDRIGTPADIAAAATATGRWTDAAIRRYGTTVTAKITEITGLWYGTWRTDPVRIILVADTRRKPATAGYDIAIVTTDLKTTATDIIARYSHRWAIEVAFHEGKNIVGVGETQNRVPKAVQRSVPFAFLTQTITTLWYTINIDPAEQIAQRRRNAPWYRTKTDPSTLDMLHALRYAIHTAGINPITPGQPTTDQKPKPQVTAPTGTP